MPWIDLLDQKLDAALTALSGLTGSLGTIWLPGLLESVKDLQHRCKAIRRAVAAVPSLELREEPMEPGVASLVTIPISNEEDERALQINAFRIAILDLNEICDELTYNFWIALLSRKHDVGDSSLAGPLLAETIIRSAVLKRSGNALVPGGHGHLATLRNAFVHKPFKDYATKIVPQGSPRAGQKLIFEFALPDDEGSVYSRSVFGPLSRLGERDGGGDEDFSSSLKRDLSSALRSSGRMATDVTDAFVTKISGFGAVAKRVHLGSLT